MRRETRAGARERVDEERDVMTELRPIGQGDWDRFAERYSVPENVRQYMARLFSTLQVRFALAAPDRFGVGETGRVLASLGEDPAGAAEFLRKQYKIGFLDLVDEAQTSWELAGYATFLDVWPVWENEEYRSRFTPEELRDIDWKYFHASFDPRERQAREQGVAPTEDEVYTLQETLDWIDRNGRPAYLSFCDCRSLAGDCGKPRETCISYRDGINTYAHRGWSRRLSVEQTKEAVRKFDRAGLMHTLNGTTICNCCGDCCYLSRGREQLGSGPNWPLAHHVVEYDRERCVGCGLCVRRCWRDVFERTPDRKVSVDATRCVGCGLCANTCPAGALTMAEASYPGLRPEEPDPSRVHSH
ncbi:4Fe-4S dicluster domain-containing protein [Olsenella sp. CA-Schmier-601-WT-1]|uniref:4Fe-4S dicluster domain-containing protein n=2 Tax=Olsenella porci TaxID=2652279 RepID=A0A6N7XQ03_9ACTN|nr:4Fe-4S dicluster domain-containing protein [Olsenella porci]